MSDLISQLGRLFASTIGFLIVLMIALSVMARFAGLLVWLAVLIVLLIIARLVWARTARH